MTAHTLLLVVALCNCINSASANSNACSTVWSYLPPGSNKCKCGQSLEGGIMCFNDEVYLRVDFTMTLDYENSHQVVVALNEYGYDNYSTLNERVYTLLPNKSKDLNKMLCAPSKRKGFLYGQLNR